MNIRHQSRIASTYNNNNNNNETHSIVGDNHEFYPDSFLCPITKLPFKNPVMADDGHSYELEAIRQWLSYKSTSPLTRRPLRSTNLVDNYALKKTLNDFETTILPRLKRLKEMDAMMDNVSSTMQAQEQELNQLKSQMSPVKPKPGIPIQHALFRMSPFFHPTFRQEEKPNAHEPPELIKAIINGEVQAIGDYLNAGDNIEMRHGRNRATPFILAVRLFVEHPDARARDIVTLLQKRGANINAVDNHGDSALHWAAYHNSSWLVHFLLAQGANPGLKNKMNETPRDKLFKYNTRSFNSELLRSLVMAEKRFSRALGGGWVNNHLPAANPPPRISHRLGGR